MTASSHVSAALMHEEAFFVGGRNNVPCTCKELLLQPMLLLRSVVRE